MFKIPISCDILMIKKIKAPKHIYIYCIHIYKYIYIFFVYQPLLDPCSVRCPETLLERTSSVDSGRKMKHRRLSASQPMPAIQAGGLCFWKEHSNTQYVKLS